jgi:hypothetical protein
MGTLGTTDPEYESRPRNTEFRSVFVAKWEFSVKP